MKPHPLSVFLLSVLFTLTLWKGHCLSLDSISELAGQYQRSIVEVIALDQENRILRTGTGFFVDQQGVIATGHHVLEGSTKAMVRLDDGQMGEVITILGDDPACDLLLIETSFRDTFPIPFGDSCKASEGERVLILGHSVGWERVISLGRILGSRKAGSLELLQLSAALLPGCSGAPVLNLRGEVVAVAAAFADFPRELNFAVPIRYLGTLKPARANWRSLEEKSVRFQASMTDAAVTEILIDKTEIPNEAQPRPWQTLIPSGPCPVYFKNGRRVLCDAAWKEAGTVFLVLHGKGFAIGYREEEIDMKRSFDL